MTEREADLGSLELPSAVIDRGPLAATVTTFILAAKSRVIVLHGKLASGKTELVRRWVIPELRFAKQPEGYEVWYGDCTPRFPDSFTGPDGTERFQDLVVRKSILVVDGFDQVFDLTRDERRNAIDHLFEQVQRKEAQAVVVLVTDSRHLTSVYALASYDPDIINAVLEVKSIGIAEGIEQLSQIHPESAASCSDEVLRALSDDGADLEENGWAVTIELIKLVDARFRRFRKEAGAKSVELRQYKEGMGGLSAILRADLEGRLEELDLERHGSREIGRAILERVLEAQAHGAAADFSDIPPRFGVSQDQLDATIERLSGTRGLLRPLGSGAYELVPPQVGAIVEDDVSRRDLEDGRVSGFVEEGLRSWQLLGNLLPRPRFAEVHRARTHLVLENDQVRFLLECALRHEGDESSGASQYWLRRLSDRVDGMDILLSSLFDDGREVRLRGASLLRGFPEPEVRERLRILALTDQDPAVRAQAVSSLEGMQDEALMELLIQEARDLKSPQRGEAIESLHIFRNERVASLLQGLVNDPDTEVRLREKAIHALSLLAMPSAVDGLLAIALHDADREDRDAAAVALASIESRDLNGHLLSRLKEPGKMARVRSTRITLCLIAVLLMAPAAAISFSSFKAVGVAVSLLGSLLLLVLTRALLLGLLDHRVKRASPLGILGAALLVLATLSVFIWVHGLAHLITRRWRRGLGLLATETLGLVLIVASSWFAVVLPVLGWFYLGVGVLLFLGSYVRDVVGVMFDTIVLTGTTRLERRKAAIYQQIFKNPAAAGLVVEALNRRPSSDVKWARVLLKRFGKYAKPDQLVDLLKDGEQAGMNLVLRALTNAKPEETVGKLESLWALADRNLRRRIAAILYRKPSERSLDALDRVRPSMSLMLRLRTTVAKWQFRFSVWPLPTRVAILLLVPTAAVFVYHGMKASQNSAWSLIMNLRRSGIGSLRPPRSEQQVAIVNFLADVYPKESATELLHLFQSRRTRGLDSISAAMAQGLVRIHARGWGDSGGNLGKELLSAADWLNEFLSARDSTDFGFALSFLRTMADEPDSVLGAKATWLLVGFVSRPEDSPDARRMQAIDSLGSLRFDRALPALDSLLRLRGQQSRVEGLIRSQVSRTAVRAFEAIAPDSAFSREGKALLAVLFSAPGRPAEGAQSATRPRNGSAEG